MKIKEASRKRNEVLAILKSNIKYKNYIFFKENEKFNKIFLGQAISLVQTHYLMIHADNTDKISEVEGTFRWENNEIISLNGDVFSPETLVMGYKWSEDNKILDILTDEWWLD